MVGSLKKNDLSLDYTAGECCQLFTGRPSISASVSVSEDARFLRTRLNRPLPQPCYHLVLHPKGATMRWYHYLAYFFGGLFLANALPHLGNGVSGHAFQSPFASPPGVGLSSSTVNVLWGLFNLAVGYLLVCRVGSFSLRKTAHVLVLGAGILVMSLNLAHWFGRLHGGL